MLLILLVMTILVLLLDKAHRFDYDIDNLTHKSDDEEEVTVYPSEQKAAGTMRGAWKDTVNTSFSSTLKRNE